MWLCWNLKGNAMTLAEWLAMPRDDRELLCAVLEHRIEQHNEEAEK